MALGTNGDSICVRDGLDVVAQCREQEKNPRKGVLCAAGQKPPEGSFCFVGNTDYTEKDYLDAQKTQRIGNGRWCNSPVTYVAVSHICHLLCSCPICVLSLKQRMGNGRWRNSPMSVSVFFCCVRPLAH